MPGTTQTPGWRDTIEVVVVGPIAYTTGGVAVTLQNLVNVQKANATLVGIPTDGYQPVANVIGSLGALKLQFATIATTGLLTELATTASVTATVAVHAWGW